MYFNKYIKYLFIILAVIVIFYSFYHFDKNNLIEGNKNKRIKKSGKKTSKKQMDIMNNIDVKE
jgi:hypothetical protein